MKKDTYLERLGNKIAELRASKGYSQVEFSKLIGISRMQLHRIEKGETNTSIEAVRLIATALDVKVSEFVDMD